MLIKKLPLSYKDIEYLEAAKSDLLCISGGHRNNCFDSIELTKNQCEICKAIVKIEKIIEHANKHKR